MKEKSVTARKRERAAIRRDMTAQLERLGKNTPCNKDLVEQYLDSRERYLDAKREYERGREAGLPPSELTEESGAMNREAENMERFHGILGVGPRSDRRAGLEEEIRTQLAAKGMKGPVFEDRIDQFLALWDAFQEANRSLAARGRTYTTTSSAGKEYEKDNAACRDIVSLAKAMQDILGDLEVNVRGYTELDEGGGTAW